MWIFGDEGLYFKAASEASAASQKRTTEPLTPDTLPFGEYALRTRWAGLLRPVCCGDPPRFDQRYPSFPRAVARVGLQHYGAGAETSRGFPQHHSAEGLGERLWSDA